MSAVQEAPPQAQTCPGCGTPLTPGQDWCLRCGRGATTRVVPPPNWRIPIAIVAVLVALAGAGVAVLFVALAGDDERLVRSDELTRTITVTTGAPAPVPAPPATAPPVTPTATTPATPPTVTATTPETAPRTPSPGGTPPGD